jgi:hypothetical protein
MKCILPFLLIFTSFTAAAQQRFEGMISYLLVSADSSIQLNIDAWYKKDKIKFVTTVKKLPVAGMYKNETIVLDFKKAVIDRVKDDRKIIERESMTGSGKKQDIPALKNYGDTTILGHLCSGFGSGKFSKEEKKDSKAVTTSGEFRIWYANDLFFNVPDSLKMIQMVPLFTNGHVALGSNIAIAQAGTNIALRTQATEIKSIKRLKRSVFRYPKHYKLRANE